jgi:hypothetical protein
MGQSCALQVAAAGAAQAAAVVETAGGGAHGWAPAFDEAGYRHEARRLGITAPQVDSPRR